MLLPEVMDDTNIFLDKLRCCCKANIYELISYKRWKFFDIINIHLRLVVARSWNMDSMPQKIVSLLWMFLCYFVFTLINIGSDLSLSHNLIIKSKNETFNPRSDIPQDQQINLKSTTFIFGLVVLAPALISFVFNILKWMVHENSSLECGSRMVPSKVISWIISPFYSVYMVFKILFKAMKGDDTWEDDKALLEGEVGYHEAGVQSMLQVTILGVCTFNALYSWVLRTLKIINLKTEVT